MKPWVSGLIVIAFSGLIASNGYGKDDSIQTSKVGQLSIGKQAQSVYEIFGKKNTRVIDLSTEGEFSPAIEVFEGGIDNKRKADLIVEVTPKDSGYAIFRIRVNDQKYRLSNAVGIGSPLQEVKTKFQDYEIVQGEGQTVLILKGQKLSLVLDSSKIPKKYYENFDQKLLPSDLKVTQILVY